MPDIRGDLFDLAARFERRATHFEVQLRRGVARDEGKDLADIRQAGDAPYILNRTDFALPNCGGMSRSEP